MSESMNAVSLCVDGSESKVNLFIQILIANKIKGGNLFQTSPRKRSFSRLEKCFHKKSNQDIVSVSPQSWHTYEQVCIRVRGQHLVVCLFFWCLFKFLFSSFSIFWLFRSYLIYPTLFITNGLDLSSIANMLLNGVARFIQMAVGSPHISEDIDGLRGY